MEGNNKETAFIEGSIIIEEPITDNTKIIAKVLRRKNDGAKFVSIQKYYQLSAEQGKWRPGSDRITIPFEHKNEIAKAIFNYEE